MCSTKWTAGCGEASRDIHPWNMCKDGFNYHGAEIDVMGGSFGRIQGSAKAVVFEHLHFATALLDLRGFLSTHSSGISEHLNSRVASSARTYTGAADGIADLCRPCGTTSWEKHPMRTKDELADFLRQGTGEGMLVSHKTMVDIFDFAITAETVNEWLQSTALNFEAEGPSQGTVPQWSFRRKK
jgi:hypothetical protein